MKDVILNYILPINEIAKYDNCEQYVYGNMRSFLALCDPYLVVDIMKCLHGELTLQQVLNEFRKDRPWDNDFIEKHAKNVIQWTIVLDLCDLELSKDNIKYLEWYYRLRSSEDSFGLWSHKMEKVEFEYDSTIIKRIVNTFRSFIRDEVYYNNSTSRFISYLFIILMSYYYSKDDDDACILLCKLIHEYFEHTHDMIYNVLRNKPTSKNITLTKQLKLDRPITIVPIRKSGTVLYYILNMYEKYYPELYNLFATKYMQLDFICKNIIHCEYCISQQTEMKYVKHIMQFVDNKIKLKQQFKFVDYINLRTHFVRDAYTNKIIIYFMQNYKMFNYFLNFMILHDNLSWTDVTIAINSKEYCELISKWLRQNTVQKGVVMVKHILDTLTDNDEYEFKNMFINTLASKNAKIQGILTEALLQ